MLWLFAAILVVGCSAWLAACGSDENGSGPATSQDGVPLTSDVPGPIRVQQLIARSADTPVAVQGLLHVTKADARLCAAVMESYPVQCGEPSVELVGLDLAAVEGLTTAGDVTWKEGAVLTVERVGDGRFAVVDIVASVTVTLGIYSGLPDPTWALTTEQASQLAGVMAKLTKVDGALPPGGLGYHGFSIVGPSGTFVAFEGLVTSMGTDPPYFLDDPDRAVERFLLETGRSLLKPEEVSEVESALDHP